MKGVSANIMLGQEPKCGTGSVDIMFDEEKYAELYTETMQETEQSEIEEQTAIEDFCNENSIADDLYDNL